MTFDWYLLTSGGISNYRLRGYCAFEIESTANEANREQPAWILDLNSSPWR